MIIKIERAQRFRWLPDNYRSMYESKFGIKAFKWLWWSVSWWGNDTEAMKLEEARKVERASYRSKIVEMLDA